MPLDTTTLPSFSAGHLHTLFGSALCLTPPLSCVCLGVAVVEDSPPPLSYADVYPPDRRQADPDLDASLRVLEEAQDKLGRGVDNAEVIRCGQIAAMYVHSHRRCIHICPFVSQVV